MSKELKNFKLTNKGGYPMNVVACIEGYRMDKNPEDIIDDLMKKEGTLEGDKEYIERIEDCINSFPVNLNNYKNRPYSNWFPLNCYFIIAFIAYFKDGNSIENIIKGTIYTKNLAIDMVTKVIEILSLDFYSDIIFDSINLSYTLDSSIIGLDTRFSNSLMRYRNNSYPNGIKTLNEVVYEVYVVVKLTEGQNLKDSVHEAFKDVRGIGNVYEASLEALYILYTKYAQEKILENMDEVYKEAIDTLHTEIDETEDEKISEEDKIEYCRNRVNLYDAIHYLISLDSDLVSIDSSCHNYESQLSSDSTILSRDLLLKALQMYYNFIYREG